MSAAGAQTGGWTPARSVAGGRNPWTIIAVISIATFMVVLDTSIANVALAHIAGSVSASYDEATWVITSFLISNAIVIPISGWLADVIGRKRYYMLSVTLFTLSSLLCGLAPSLGFLVVARVLQGIGGGGLTPVEQSMLVDTFPPEKRGLAFAAYGVVVIAGPIFGPTIGGYITDNASWHWVFLINVPIGILSLILVTLFVDEPKAVRDRTKKLRKQGLKVDYIGFLLVAVSLGCLEVTLDRGQRDDWFSSPLITIFAILSVSCFLIFIPYELSLKNPIVKLRLFANRNFAIANVLLLMMGVIIFGSTQFIPQLLQEVMHYTATSAGMALTAGGLATIFVMPISGFLTGKIDPRYLIGLAFTIQGLALLNMSHLSTQMSFDDAAYARMFQSVGLPFLFVPVTNAAYVGLRPQDSNQASALMNVTRNLGGTFGISLVQTLLAQREQVHQAQLVESLNNLNPGYTAGLQKIAHALAANGLSQAEATRAAAAQIYQSLQQQVGMLSYIDAFHVLMILVFGAIPLILLMNPPEKGKPDAGEGGAA
ncbi:MAG TPA: DHA2 family efflux MFS transporter permease subunit [Rhizomicrobium sp.]